MSVWEELNKIDDEEALLEMATVGKYSGVGVDGKKIRKVFTTSDSEYKTVHVHISNFGKSDVELNVCVRLDSPEYFIHGKYKDKFTREDKMQFIKFMKSPYKGDVTFRGCKFRTMWDFTILQWNNENDGTIIPIEEGNDGYVKTIPMPDYSQLPTESEAQRKKRK